MNNCAKYHPYVHTSNTPGDYYLTSRSSNVVTCSICGMCFSDHIPATHPCSPWRKFPEYKPEEGQLVFIADISRTNIQVSAIYTDNKFQVCDSNGEICASFGSDPPEYWMPMQKQESSKFQTLIKYNNLIKDCMAVKDWAMVKHYRELVERMQFSDKKKKITKSKRQARKQRGSMIMMRECIDWFKSANKETQESMYNFVIYSLCGLRFRDRVAIAYELLRGKAYCIKISADQKSDPT